MHSAAVDQPGDGPEVLAWRAGYRARMAASNAAAGTRAGAIQGTAALSNWRDEALEVGRHVLVRMVCAEILAGMQGPQDERACRPATAVALVLGLRR